MCLLDSRTGTKFELPDFERTSYLRAKIIAEKAGSDIKFEVLIAMTEIGSDLSDLIEESGEVD